MRTIVTIAVLFGAALFATASQATPLPKPRPNIVDVSSPLTCLAYVVYKEARGESFEGRLTVAYVTKIRAWLPLPGFGDRSICGVAKAKGQYQGVERNLRFAVVKERSAWQQSLDVAQIVLSGRFVPEGELRFATYYLNPKTSSLEGKCWFAKNLVAIKQPQDSEHVFYREPLRRERILLGLSMPDECIGKKPATTLASR